MSGADPRCKDSSAVTASSAKRSRSYICCNTRIDAITLDDAVAALCTPTTSGRAVHLCNAATLSLTSRDVAFADCVTRGDLNLPDGMPLVWIARRLGISLPSRVYGPDLMAATLDRGRQAGLRHYLYGSTTDVIRKLTQRIETRWPGAAIVGAESAPFRPLNADEQDALVVRMLGAKPDVVWVALGTPKQDVFIDEFRDRLGATLVAVGAAFDFYAETVSQAPKWMQDRGLEWAYRLSQEPRRLWRRYLIGNVVFLAGVVKHPPRRIFPNAGRPTGTVLIVGPDGTGKTALADGLTQRAEAEGIKVYRAHWRPGILFGRRSDGAPVTLPHSVSPRGLLVSLLKVALSLADVWVAFLGPWRQPRRNGLVLWERGWHDQLVDPVRYRLHPTVRPIASLLARLIPRVDAVILVEGQGETVHRRKPELVPSEIDDQLDRWREMAHRTAKRVIRVDTVRNDRQKATDIAYRALSIAADLDSPDKSLEPLLPGPTEWQSLPLTPPRLEMKALGGSRAVPAFAIYRPQRARSRLASRVGRLVFSAGGAPFTDTPKVDIPYLLADLAPGATGWVVMRSSTPDRLIVGAAASRVLILVAKIGGEDDLGLANEAQMLRTLSNLRPPFVLPSVRWSGLRERWRVLALDPLPLRTGRIFDEEILRVSIKLATGPGVVHGDLAPWNVIRSDGGTVLLDWEHARKGSEPLFDLAHFVIQRGALVTRTPPLKVLMTLTGPGSLGVRYLKGIGEDANNAPSLLRNYLESMPPTANLGLSEYRAELLKELL